MASVIGDGPRGAGNDRHQRSAGRAPPRLMISHSLPDVGVTASSSISQAEIASFAPLAIELEAHDLLAEVDTYLARGLSAEAIFIELLAPAARYLGEEWTADRLDFLDVTMGLWRLQEVLREVAARGGPNFSPAFGRRVLFSPMPGDQHSFGAAMIDECFTRAGWSSNLLVEPTRGQLLSSVASTDYALVGLTVSCDCHIGVLTALVSAIRNVSRNPNVRVMLGGRLLIDDPDIARRAGADATALTALGALELAEQLVAAPLNAAYA